MPKSAEKPRTLLVTRFSALGDVAMTIPVIYSACRSNPDTRFIFVTRKVMASMFVNPPENLTVRGIDLKADYSGTTGMWRLFHDLKAEYDFDAIADLHGVLRTFIIGLLGRLYGVKSCAIRKGRKGKRALTRANNKVMLPLISSRARYREVLYRLGLTVEDKFRGLYDGDKGDPALFADVTQPKQPGERWVGIAPFAKHKGKIYPPELMEQVVAQVAAMPSTKVFLFGAGQDEQDVLARWAEKYTGATSIADKRRGFPVELALMSHLDTMLTMDSGNMHLASLVGVRVVSIWGATHPYCGFKGYKQRERDIIQLPMTCRPCSVFGNKPCSRGDYYCLAGIAPKLIVSKLQSILDHNNPANTAPDQK